MFCFMQHLFQLFLSFSVFIDDTNMDIISFKLDFIMEYSLCDIMFDSFSKSNQYSVSSASFKAMDNLLIISLGP